MSWPSQMVLTPWVKWVIYCKIVFVASYPVSAILIVF